MCLKKIMAGAAALLIAAMFTGCMNSEAGSIDSDRKMSSLSISVTEVPNDYEQLFLASYPKNESSSRSITPNDPYEIADTGLSFVLKGKSETGLTFGPKTVTLTEGAVNSGHYNFGETITLESMLWTLTLTAYNDSPAPAADTEGTKPVLIGYSTVDLRNGNGTAPFTMTTKGLETEGSVTITGKVKDDDSIVAKYTMGIYSKDKGEAVYGPEDATATTGTEHDFTYTNSTVVPGNYLFKMIFYNAKNTIIGSYVDTLIVNPGNALVRDLGTLDIIGKIPEKPENVKAYLIKDSETIEGYKVLVSWEGGKYATNFELKLTEYAGDGTDDSDVKNKTTIYGLKEMDSADPKTVEDFITSDVYGTGTGASSMLYGDKTAILNLELGKIYEIQMRARNYIGTSKDATGTDDWTNRTDATETTLTIGTDTVNVTGFESKLNRMLLTYNLNGGKLSLDGSEYTGKYAEYKTWKTGITDNDLLEITATVTLTKGTTDFNKWLLESGTGLDDSTPANEITTLNEEVSKFWYKNLNVKAFYGNSLTGDVSMEDAPLDVELSDINVSYGTEASQATEATPAAGVYSISKKQSDGTDTYVCVTLSSATTEYKNIRFELTTQSNADPESLVVTDTNKCVFSLGKYVPGKISVRVIADTNVKDRSQTITLDIY